MLFNSYEFLLFLPVCLLSYWLLNRWLWAQNLWLVAASYFFYAWWDVRFLALIASLTLVGFLSGIGMERLGRESRWGKTFFILGILLCIGVLGTFKYYDFFASSLQTLLEHFGFTPNFSLLRIILPVGISFYTFQILSYIIDVRRVKIRASFDLLSFAAFVSFFPQLVAGPIERATHLLPQMKQRRTLTYECAVDGLRQILWGFTKKMLVADRCAPIVEAVYSNPNADGTDLWWAAILFAFQLYGDFSGYSDIAIGTARLFGIRLTRNFRTPFFSRSTAEFWRNWHVSLMAWFKEYIYIPLGGSHKGVCRKCFNIFIVFLVSGLWHGANYTFIAWGVYCFLWFLPEIFLKKKVEAKGIQMFGATSLPSLKELAQMFATFLIFVGGMVFFRSESIEVAFLRIEHMFVDFHLHSPYGGLTTLLTPLFMLLVEWLTRKGNHGLDIQGHGLLRFRTARWLLYYTLIFCIFYWGGRLTDFIYFQF